MGLLSALTTDVSAILAVSTIAVASIVNAVGAGTAQLLYGVLSSLNTALAGL